MTWVDSVNFMAAGCGLTSALLGLIITISISYIEKSSRRFFVVFFIIISAYVSSDLISQFSLAFFGYGANYLSAAAIFCESLFSSMLMPLLMLYILRCAGEDHRTKPVFYAVCFFWAVYVLLLVITQFTDSIYYITADNVYHRGSLYPLLLVPPVVMMLTNCIVLYKRRAVLTQREVTAFTIYLSVPLLCMIIQMLSYGLLMIVIGTSLSALCMLIFILKDHIELYIGQCKKIAQQEANITVLQMRPHFIYNTLMSIYYLCGQDAKKAQQMILDFTTYLRNNFNAIAKHGDIPFTDELNHAQAYLAVEKARFDDKLYVEFDTPHKNFRVPPLTLQPIVENSIKHGLGPDLDPLYISVVTRIAEGGSEITVEDTGPGFPPVDNDAPHLALDNIRTRLEMMCKGTLTIEPRRSGGTKGTIFVPDKEPNNEDG